MTVTFAHESGSPTYRVPGYFAGDGNAAESSATRTDSPETLLAFADFDGTVARKPLVTTVKGGAAALLGMPPDNASEDWLAVVRRN